MRALLPFAAAAVFSCSGRIETFSVSPDQKHVLIGHAYELKSVDVETLAEVGHVADVYPDPLRFSRDGSKAILRSTHDTIVVFPTAGGNAVDLGPALVFPEISPDGSRLAFLRNVGACPGDREVDCTDLYSVPTAGGEAVRVGSGIRVSMSYYPAGTVTASRLYDYAFADDDTLVFQSFDGLMWAPADGSAPPALLVPGTAPRFPGLPPVVPGFSRFYDGRVIARDDTGSVLLDPRGGTRVRLAEGSSTSLLCARVPFLSLDYTCRPSAAGMLASYTSDGPTWTVQTIPFTGGTSVTVTAQPNSAYLDPDRGLVFFDPDGFLTLADSSGQIRQIGRPVIEGYRSAISPEGSWQSFLKQRLDRATPCINCDTLHLLSVGTAATWTLKVGGNELFIVGHAFSPDSSSILFLTHDRRLGFVPVAGGEPRILQSDVDGAGWVGSDHVAMSRTRSSPAGVQILRVR
jgi:hypothetical protein